MVNSLTIKNYKAFAEARIEIKPITLFLGANSSGKTSLLQLFLMLAQSGGNETTAPHLRLNGNLISLGDSLNVLHKRDPDSKLELSFEIDSVAAIRANWIQEFFQSVIYECFDLAKTPSNGLEKGFAENFRALIIKTKGELQDYQKLVEMFPELLTLLRSAKDLIAQRRRRNGKKQKGTVEESLSELVSSKRPDPERILGIDRMLDLISVLSPIRSIPSIDRIQYVFRYKKSSRELELASLAIFQGRTKVFGYSASLSGRPINNFESDIFNTDLLKKHRSSLKEVLKFDGLACVNVGSLYPYPGRRDSFGELFGDMLGRATGLIHKAFNERDIRHVSPLRAFPQRYYLLDRDSGGKYLNTRDGNALAEILRGNVRLRTQVNLWLRKFGMAVNVHDIKQFIHAIKVRQNGLDMDLTDVGFGISQVLPVIVQGFLGANGTTTVIEQPEIHLHPKMQAELADLSIDITKTNQSRLIIETHSEYLLKRLRRRIAEGHMAAADVAIYLVNGSAASRRTKSTLEELEIGDQGSFKWPADFTETEFEDTIAFAKLQNGGGRSKERA